MSKEQNRLGTNPLGGALDWLEQEPARPQPFPASAASTPDNAPPEPAPTALPVVDDVQADSTRRGVAAGYRRHTLLMRDDHIEQLDRLIALERLSAGQNGRNKKDLVEQAFDLFFQSNMGQPGP